MPKFKIEVKAYCIVFCTRVQMFPAVHSTKIDIDKDGNGSITLSALNLVEAMDFVREQLAICKKDK